MPEENGTIELPTHDITIKYDPDKQSVAVICDAKQFKSMEHVLGVLLMAKLHLEHNRNVQLAARMQQAAMMEMQNQAIANQREQAIRGIVSGR